jgi:hypothetical protein
MPYNLPGKARFEANTYEEFCTGLQQFSRSTQNLLRYSAIWVFLTD